MKYKTCIQKNKYLEGAKKEKRTQEEDVHP